MIESIPTSSQHPEKNPFQEGTLNAQTLVDSYQLTAENLQAFRDAGAHIDVKTLVESFYEWLEQRSEYHHFFQDSQTLERVKSRQRSYWQHFLGAVIDDSYIDSRLHVGYVHARIKLGIHIYFAAMNYCVGWLRDTFNRSAPPTTESLPILDTLERLSHLDCAIVIAAISTKYTETISEQSRALMEMSTPVIKVWDGIVLLPLVGVIDSFRAGQVMEGLLHAVVDTESQTAILDVTGVPIIDTYVAQHLMHTVNAVRMLGAEVIFTGFSPETAQTLTRLNVNVSTLQTAGSLRAGLAKAFQKNGWLIVNKTTAPRSP